MDGTSSEIRREWECLIEVFSSGFIHPRELPSYGMNYPEDAAPTTPSGENCG